MLSVKVVNDSPLNVNSFSAIVVKASGIWVPFPVSCSGANFADEYLLFIYEKVS